MADQAETLRAAVNAQKLRPSLRVVAVTSGKGGVGKTHLAANLAILAAKAGRRVLVIDADLALANVEILYGLQPRYDIRNLISQDAPLEDVLARGPHGVRVLSAGTGMQALTGLTDPQKLDLVNALDPLEDAFDVIFIDTSAGVGDNVVFFAGAAQEALLVVTPEPTSLTDAYTALKVLSTRAGLTRFNVVVNFAGDKEARATFDRLAGVAQRFLSARLTYVGCVPRDDRVARALMMRRPVVDVFPGCPAVLALDGISQRLFQPQQAPEMNGGMKFLWKRLLRETEHEMAE